MGLKIDALPEKWQERWCKEGFDAPALIQKEVYQPLLEGKDVLGISPTGSGKTLAYLLPLLQRVQPGAGMQLLILTASQELAMQVADVAKGWSEDLGLKQQSLIGGANPKRQIEKLKQKPEVLIGTSGRVHELIQQKKVKSAQIKMVVLDEADQLMQEQLTSLVIKAIGVKGQFAYFSATGTQAEKEILDLRPETAVFDVSQTDKSASQISHYFLKVAPRKRVEELRRVANVKDFQGLVFFSEVNELGDAEAKLSYHGLAVAGLASDQNKMLRKAAISKFRAGQLALLLATDIAARGLDITDLAYVINADLPNSKEDYLHRSGRTGRMGKTGSVITFVNEGNLSVYQRLMRSLKLEAKEIFLYDGALQFVPKTKSERPVQKKRKKKK